MVIQRWQSVFLLIGAIAMGLSAFLPTAQCAAMGDGSAICFRALDCIPLFVADCLTAVLALIAIFMYGNLRQQKRLAMVVTFLAVVAMAATFFAISNVGQTAPVELLWPILLPLLAAIFFACACWRIRADERLLRSYDRLR